MIPLRNPGYDWSLYLPGNTSDTLWTSYLPFDKLPQVLNPPSGFIQNANSTPFLTTSGPGNPDPAQYAPSLGIETYPTNRSLRAVEMFSSNPAITFDQFISDKFDMSYSPNGSVAAYVVAIQKATFTDPDLLAGQSLVGQWDLRANPESTTATQDASSPHSADQAPLFVQRKLKPAWFEEADIRTHLEREYQP